MDYQVSARKWRPQTFEEVIGQKHVTTSLGNAIRLGKIAQAYLFSGIRGVGKTSLARILAKGVNCKKEGPSMPCNVCEPCREITEGRSVDVIEVDGASNTGVDDVRELRENVKYLPLRGRYKVYIIDEVHMLSNAAFNALLKTLEEPPPHLLFILATTESHKIPQTILSRCQHFAFRRMTASEIVSQLRRVIETPGIQFTERGLNLIARVSEGSMRDALSLIDQAISFSGTVVSDDDLFTLLGRMDGAAFHRLMEAIHKKDAAAALSVAKDLSDQGCDLRQFLTDWLERLRHVIVCQNVSDAGLWIDLSKEEISEIEAEAALFSFEAMQRLFSLFARLLSGIRNAPQPNLLFEVALMKAILLADTQSIEAVIERLGHLAEGQAISQGLLETPSATSIPEHQEPVGLPLVQKTNRVPEKKSTVLETTQALDTPLKKEELVKKEELASPITGPRASLRSRTDEAPSPITSSFIPALPEAALRDEGGPKPVLNGASRWQALLSALKQERPNVGSYLEQGRLEYFGPQEIRIVFPQNSAFLIPLIEKPDTQTWLNEWLRTQVGNVVRLRLSPHSEDPSREPISTGTRALTGGKPAFNAERFEKTEPPAMKKEIKGEHPLIQEILKVMGGTLIETKRVTNE